MFLCWLALRLVSRLGWEILFDIELMILLLLGSYGFESAACGLETRIDDDALTKQPKNIPADLDLNYITI